MNDYVPGLPFVEDEAMHVRVSLQALKGQESYTQGRQLGGAPSLLTPRVTSCSRLPQL